MVSISVTLGILVIILLLRFNSKKITLAIIYALYTLIILFFHFVFLSDNFYIAAIFSVHFYPFFSLIGPVFWIYVRSELFNTGTSLSKDFKHFIVFILLFLLTIPHYFTSLTYKINEVKFIREQNILILQNHLIPFIPTYFLIFFFIVFNAAYLLFCIYKVLTYQLIYKNYLQKDILKIRVFWLKILLFTNLFCFSILLFISVNGIYFSNEQFVSSITILISFTDICLVTVIFYFPNIIYGIDKNFNKITKKIPRKSLKFNEKSIAKFEEQLNSLLYHNQHLNSNFTKAFIIMETKVTDKLFTYYFNEYQNKNFNQWRNEKRIEHSINMINEGYLNEKTIESLANEVGFRSRNSYTYYFKKFMGNLPSQN